MLAILKESPGCFCLRPELHKRGSVQNRPPLAGGHRQISGAELVGTAVGADIEALAVAHVRQVLEDRQDRRLGKGAAPEGDRGGNPLQRSSGQAHAAGEHPVELAAIGQRQRRQFHQSVVDQESVSHRLHRLQVTPWPP